MPESSPRDPLAPAARGIIDRLAYSVDEAAQALGISRARLYELIADGTIPSVKLGRRRLIRRETLVRLLEDLETSAA